MKIKKIGKSKLKRIFNKEFLNDLKKRVIKSLKRRKKN